MNLQVVEIEKDLEVNEHNVIMDGNGGYVSTYRKDALEVLEKKISNLEAMMEVRKTEDTQHIQNSKDVLKLVSVFRKNNCIIFLLIQEYTEKWE